MKHELSVTRAILVASLMLLPLILPVGTFGAEPEKGTRALQNEGLKQLAVENVRDSLKACLGRIPEDASAGQLMLAEQNCQHVAIERTETSLSF
jgi:hypothetical protein